MLHKFPISTIVIAQLLGGSLWFSTNGVADQLLNAWTLSTTQLGYLTSAVQLGFIVGTFIFAISGLSDRFKASHIFFVSCITGAAANAALPLLSHLFSHPIESALVFRFFTGLALAGIYPLGMKLIISWAPEKSGLALGWLVGMLTLGTALPHLFQSLNLINGEIQWQMVILVSSFLAIIAGIIILFLGDGKHLKPNASFNKNAAKIAFAIPAFRSAAFGYFGHMWELYAFWTITPLLVFNILKNTAHWNNEFYVASFSFLIMGIGFFGCVIGGFLSHYYGSRKVASIALTGSGLCCLVFPFSFTQSLPPFFLLFILAAWGILAVADSPQFSAMSAKACPKNIVGSALSIQNSIGFFITIISISLVTHFYESIGAYVTWILLPGPIIGLFMMRYALREKAVS